jgi:hypothetical protein
MVQKHGDLQKIIEDEMKVLRCMPLGDLLEYQGNIGLEV